MAISRYCCYKEVVPFMSMFSAECSIVGLKTLFKAASLEGMDTQVFLFYSYAFSTLVLLPLSFIFHRRTVLQLPPLKFSILWRIFLLGLLGLSTQMIGYKGVEYSSPTLAAANSNLIAPYTFILAVVFRMEKLNLRSWRTRAKIVGTIRCIDSDSIHGPNNFTHNLSNSLHIISSASRFGPVQLGHWWCLTCHPVYFVFLLDHLSGRSISFWRLKSDMATFAIVYAAFLGPSFSTVLHLWGTRVKGPFYVASFRPLSIAIAAAMGIVFLGDPLTVGCVFQGFIASLGERK